MARSQWKQYCEALESAGYQVVVLDSNHTYPDSPFVEDAVVVVDDLAVQTRIGTPSRRGESRLLADFLSPTHRLAKIDPPGLLDGGDVLRVANRYYVGTSGRTNRSGFEQFHRLVASLGYDALPVEVKGCLHLKTGCTALSQNTVLLNPHWVDCSFFAGLRTLKVEPEEPFAANVLTTETAIFVATGSPRRTALLEAHGYRVKELNISEFEKAEAGLTCLSVLIHDEC